MEVGASMVRMGWRPAIFSVHFLSIIFPMLYKIQNVNRLPQHIPDKGP